jgi:hypothetical protein
VGGHIVEYAASISGSSSRSRYHPDGDPVSEPWLSDDIVGRCEFDIVLVESTVDCRKEFSDVRAVAMAVAAVR